MAISLLLTLEERDWKDEIRGWRCDALKIPGARVDAAYAQAGALLDPASYQVDLKHAVIRWGKEASPPESVTLAVALEKPLSTQDLTARWQKIAVLMPVITAVVGAFAAHVLTDPAPPSGPSLVRYQLAGMVNLQAARAQDVQLCIKPPHLVLFPDGRFAGDIPLFLKDKRLIEPPKVLIDSGRRDYATAVVHILNKGEKAPIGVVDYEFDIDHDSKLISFRKPVEFQRVSQQGYEASQQTPVPVP